MRLIAVLALSTCLLVGTVFGGEIWGIVRTDGVPNPGKPVRIFSGKERLGEGTTDEEGIYSIFVKRNGPCMVQLYDGLSVIKTLHISSVNKPVRCDIHVLQTEWESEHGKSK